MKTRTKTLTVMVPLALLVGALVFAATSAYSQEPPAPPPGEVSKGAQVYAKSCGNCHGANGEGNLGIPALAGAAGHVTQLGIPPEVAGPAMIQMLRAGIPGNMPPFPPEALSEEDIMHLGAYMFTVPPTTGANIYTASCALCHGTVGQGGIAQPLAGAAEKFAAMRIPKEAIAAGFPGLVRKGIPGVMPGFPHLTDVEIERLFEYLWALGSWEAEFEARHGRAPTAQDRADREWSLKFLAETGQTPTEQDWIRYTLSR